MNLFWLVKVEEIMKEFKIGAKYIVSSCEGNLPDMFND